MLLRTTVAHNTGQNSSDNLPSYPPDNHCLYVGEGETKYAVPFILRTALPDMLQNCLRPPM